MIRLFLIHMINADISKNENYCFLVYSILIHVLKQVSLELFVVSLKTEKHSDLANQSKRHFLTYFQQP